jgi:hypothetical protein
MLTEKLPKVAQKYHCNCCDYNTSKTSSYNKHLTTAKHIRKHELTQKLPEVADESIQCIQCGKSYSSRVGLWKHNKKCMMIENDIVTIETNHVDNTHNINPRIDAPTILELLKQNNEFKCLLVEQQQQIIDQNKQMMELTKNAGTTINNNCNNNNKFNLNVFLNETCKEAITMNDFINSFEVTREDFIRTGNVGFVEGISTVMMKRIRNMELHTRPLHCTDLKRETVYIKNDDKWEKEDIDKTHLRKAVKTVAHKNMNELKRWYCDSKPEVDTIGTDAYENYFKYYQAALGGYDKEEDIKFEEKIIKNVLKEVQVDKTLTAV